MKRSPVGIADGITGSQAADGLPLLPQGQLGGPIGGKAQVDALADVPRRDFVKATRDGDGGVVFDPTAHLLVEDPIDLLGSQTGDGGLIQVPQIAV